MTSMTEPPLGMVKQIERLERELAEARCQNTALKQVNMEREVDAATVLIDVQTVAHNAAIEEAAKVAEARDLSIMSSTVVDVEVRKIAAAIRSLVKS